MRLRVASLAAAAWLALLPATALPGTPTRQYLDTTTAATILTMDRPIVFARDRPALAVNARDYASLVAIDVNRAGSHQLYWYGLLWTTTTGAQPALPEGAEWLLLADTRPIRLRRPAGMLRDLGIGDAPIPLPVRDATAVLFTADRESLEYIRSARQLSIRDHEGNEYRLWRDARDELAGFPAAAPN